MSMHRVRFSAYMFCYNLSIWCLKWCKLSQLCSLSYCVLLRPLILVRFFVRENSSLRSLCKRFIWEAPASLRLAMTLFFPTFVDSHHFAMDVLLVSVVWMFLSDFTSGLCKCMIGLSPACECGQSGELENKLKHLRKGSWLVAEYVFPGCLRSYWKSKNLNLSNQPFKLIALM